MLATHPDGSKPTDEELMLAAGRGSREAFAEIVDRHHARILNLLTFLTGDREMASDLTQDCFLRALRAAPRWQPAINFICGGFLPLRAGGREPG